MRSTQPSPQPSSVNSQTMSLTTFLRVSAAAMRVGIVPLWWGDAGIGKTSMARTLARLDGGRCEVVEPYKHTAIDLQGLPHVSADEHVTLIPPAWAVRAAAGETTHLLIDEVTIAGDAQKALLSVALDRRVGDLTLPREVKIIAAANPPELSVDGDDLPGPLANRFLHLDFPTGAEAWIAGMTTGWQLPAGAFDGLPDPTPERRAVTRAVVTGFIRQFPALLHDRPHGQPDKEGRAWPSHRQWERVADVLAALGPCPSDSEGTEAETVAVAGLVGQGAAQQFMAWRREADLPDPDEVTREPESIAWAGLRDDVAWAILNAVVTLAVQRGTVVAWKAAWGPLSVAAQAGRPDLAAANVRNLMAARPNNTVPPASARKLMGALTEAGVLPSNFTDAAVPA